MGDMYLENSFSLKYSRHAEVRERQRHARLDISDVRKLERAVLDAQSQTKFKRTAFFLDRTIFVVDVPEGEVITVIHEFKNKLANTYLSNIDSAVVIA